MALLDYVNATEVTPEFMQAVWKLAERSLADNAEYIKAQLAIYEQRRVNRSLARYPVTAWCGWGRSGKDEAGEWLGKNSPLAYPGGGCSLVAIPLVASATETPPEECWSTRHQRRLFWFHFLNACRDQHSQTLLVRMVLARGDMVTGIRSGIELRAAQANGCIDRTIWVHRPGVPVDVTVEYDELDCQHAIINAGTLPEYHAKLRRFCGDKLGLPIKENLNG